MSRIRVILACLLTVCIVGTLPAAGETSKQNRSSRIQWIGCPWNMPPGEELHCGRFKVPLSRSADTGKTIEIFFAVVPSLWAQPSLEPLLMIQGGPGAAWQNPTPSRLTTLTSLRVSRDIVFADQRGTWRGDPFLSCAEVKKANPKAKMIDVDRLCIEDWRRKGFDPAHFNTREIAEDFKELRVALNVERWSVYGVSYGTVVAQRLIHIDRGGVQKLVLDSATPIEPYLLSRKAMGHRLGVLQRVSYACDTIDSCSAAYGDVMQSFVSAYYALQRAPAQFQRDSTGWASGYTGLHFVRRISDMIEEPGGLRHLPYRIDQIAKHMSGERYLGSFDFYWRATQSPEDQFSTAVDVDSDPGYWSVICQEQWTPDIAADWQRDDPNEPIPLRTFLRVPLVALNSICPLFRSTPIEAKFLDNEEVPVLVLSGAYDFTTPPELSDRVAAFFRYAELVRFGHLTHGVAFETSCSIYIVSMFLNQRDASFDRDCQRYHDKPRFWLPRDYRSD